MIRALILAVLLAFWSGLGRAHSLPICTIDYSNLPCLDSSSRTVYVSGDYSRSTGPYDNMNFPEQWEMLERKMERAKMEIELARKANRIDWLDKWECVKSSVTIIEIPMHVAGGKVFDTRETCTDWLQHGIGPNGEPRLRRRKKRQ